MLKPRDSALSVQPLKYLLRRRIASFAERSKWLVVVISATVAICIVCNSCHSGRAIPPNGSYSDLDFIDLLRSRTDAQIRPATGPQFSLHRIGDRDTKSDEYGLEIVWLEFPRLKAKMSVRQISASDDADQLYARLSGNRDLALLNGGYWENREETKEGKKEEVSYPVGLVRANGREIAPFRRDMGGGVVFQTGSRFDILPTDVFEGADERPLDAVQSKPLLVDDGRTAMKSDDHRRDDRLAIGIDANGSIIIALATQPQGALTLYEFSEFLLLRIEKGGPGCVRALNLDGGPGAHVYVPSLNLHLGRHNASYVNNVIHVHY